MSRRLVSIVGFDLMMRGSITGKDKRWSKSSTESLVRSKQSIDDNKLDPRSPASVAQRS